MAEHIWLACRDPEPLLKFLQGMTSERKLRLFACACVRRIWRPSATKTALLELSERFAEGQANRKELKKARSELKFRGESATTRAENKALAAVLEDEAFTAAHSAANFAALASDPPAVEPRNKPWYFLPRIFGTHPIALSEPERNAQAILIRDIFGNPFRIVKMDPSWQAWNNGTVPKIAQAIYDDRTFNHLPILADALEEAGCTNADILGHCRGPGPHARGCWVVDLLLGKE
jgi:hypothetical protein